jgi:hypothetical protein
MTRPGAVESLVEKYLDATDQDEFEASLRAVLTASRRDVEAWHQHIIPLLVERLEAELKDARIAPNVEEGTLGELLGRWNWLGMNARFDGQIGEADAAFRALLSTLRQAQRRLGRLHKGLPLHSLGWLRLPAESAAPYILAALVEDCIRDAKGSLTPQPPRFWSTFLVGIPACSRRLKNSLTGPSLVPSRYKR